RGVGLGLAIARQIVLSHHGRLWAESQLGQGSRFYVRLPIRQKDVITKELKERN
ncbi:MAG: hypothetical protein HPY76_14830, partial [Anaerolineae bacterium]|nr:hypothetical protein [Anaerolineae bacterium]